MFQEIITEEIKTTIIAKVYISGINWDLATKTFTVIIENNSNRTIKVEKNLLIAQWKATEGFVTPLPVEPGRQIEGGVCSTIEHGKVERIDIKFISGLYDSNDHGDYVQLRVMIGNTFISHVLLPVPPPYSANDKFILQKYVKVENAEWKQVTPQKVSSYSISCKDITPKSPILLFGTTRHQMHNIPDEAYNVFDLYNIHKRKFEKDIKDYEETTNMVILSDPNTSEAQAMLKDVVAKKACLKSLDALTPVQIKGVEYLLGRTN